ncbi:L-histidine N(alpha)-methyltransferase [Rhizorhabdus argentea]|uniref:L-histidine N(alpha)-methyltransferase n=1 Tax=Rhizorhabdus argentea TaxID=1387174 RepID=UPI0030EF9CFD
MTDHPAADAPRRTEIAAFHDHGLPPADFRTLFLAGLEREEKSVADQMLLDRRSPAFRRITTLPEYYLVRAELEILQANAAAIAQATGPGAQMIDLGRGFGAQAALLLAMLDSPWGYVAVDHEHAALLEDARRIQARYPKLWVEAVCADMRQAFDLPPNAGGGRRLAYLPGSAIGDCAPTDALALLSLWARELRQGALMLVGVDLRKSVLILESAYDDSHGLNAEWLFDLLRRANRELDANFDIRLFEHRVDFDAAQGRVRAALQSVAAQDVRIDGRLVHFAEGERLDVAQSWKYSVEDFQALARGGGLRPVDVWLDAKSLFSIHLLAVG